jgi:hypothetical protein
MESWMDRIDRRMKTTTNIPCRTIAYEQSPRQLSALHCHCKNQFMPSRKHNLPRTVTLRECHRNRLAEDDGQNNEVQVSKHVLAKRNAVEVSQELDCLDVGFSEPWLTDFSCLPSRPRPPFSLRPTIPSQQAEGYQDTADTKSGGLVLVLHVGAASHVGSTERNSGPSPSL